VDRKGAVVPTKSLPERLRRRLRGQVLAPVEEHLLGSLHRLRNGRRSFTPIFVAGAMGSGTTLLAFSLGQRYDLACVIAESAHQIGRSSFLHVQGPDAARSIRSYEESIAPRADWAVEQGRADLLRLYRSHARGSSRFVLDKGPNTNLLRAGFLSRCFPEGRFVSVFRDPVVNVEGFRRKWRTFGRDSLDEAIRFYLAIHDGFLRAASTFPDRVILVEYERLVEDYDALLGAIASHIGLRPAARRRRLPRSENVPGQGIRNVARSQIGVVKDANSLAYRNLAATEVDRIREALSPLHERMRALALTP
jgi:hypothetical protein